VGAVSNYNPYQAPHMGEPTFGAAPGVPGANEAAQVVIMESLKKTRPWVLFLAILGFLGAGGMFLVGIIMMIAGAAATSFAKGAGPLDKMGPLLGLFYFVLGAFYIVPSVLMWQYGSSIGDFTRAGGTMDTLAVAVKKQAAFWRFTGISVAVMMGLYVVGIFVAVVVGVAAALPK
jgi:hypothetical protein